MRVVDLGEGDSVTVRAGHVFSTGDVHRALRAAIDGAREMHRRIEESLRPTAEIMSLRLD